MKKLLRIAVVLAMVMCLGVTAFAQGSTISIGTVETAKDESGNAVAVTVEESTVTPTVTEVASVIEEAVPTTVKGTTFTVLGVIDVHVDVMPAGGVLKGVTANDTVHVMHYNGSKWEHVQTCKGDHVWGKFTSLSPVAFVIEKAPAADTTPSTPSGESPKTGETNALAVAGVVVLLAGVTAVVALKKREEV